MERGPHWVVALAVLLVLSACRGTVSDEQIVHDPATIKHVKGTDLAHLTLTERAAERLDLQTTAVVARGRRTVIPSAAVFVDPEGTFWVYTSPEPLAFVRHKIGIDHEQGDETFLSTGPRWARR